MKAFSRGLFNLAIPLSAIALAFIGWHNFQSIEDWLKLRNYTPPSAISQLATQDTMTSKATHIFYVNHPSLIDSASTFSGVCPTNEQTIVIGCYHSGENGIFLSDVKDPRLKGVLEVTAAHEMLHGAYERLSQKDRAYVDSLLKDYYANGLHDKRIINTMKDYQQTEPNDVVNEMHSVFGTEVGNLPPKLETYYKQYFANRKIVVAFADGYENEFTRRINQINDYEKQLKSLKQTIDSEEAGLSSLLAKIESDRARLEALRSSRRISEYNAAVSAFNAEVNSYNAQVDQLRKDITEYNNLVSAHNKLAGELRSLYNSLSTDLSTQTAQ